MRFYSLITSTCLLFLLSQVLIVFLVVSHQETSEYTGFKGRIYATEPTAQIGRQFVEELHHYHIVSSTKDSPEWQRPELLRFFVYFTQLLTVYCLKSTSNRYDRTVETCTSLERLVQVDSSFGLCIC